MSTLRKIGIGCTAALVVVVLCIASLWVFVHYKQSRYDPRVIPFLDEYLVHPSTWDPTEVEGYWAPEVRAKLKPEDIERLFLLYRRLGRLKSHDRPRFRQVSATTEVPYPEVVTYKVDAIFEAGPAELTINMVTDGQGTLKIWYIEIRSNAFLPEPGHQGDLSPNRS